MTHLFALRTHGARALAFILASVLFVLAADAGAAETPSARDAGQPVRLLVLDIEIIGDLSDPALEPEHAARIARTSDLLRAELARATSYEIVDATPAHELIERLRGTQYLHRCNGCELDIALELDAQHVLVSWIHRVSALILSFTYEIREVSSGRTLRRKSFDFRGDNDEAWSRAVSYMVRDLAAEERH